MEDKEKESKLHKAAKVGTVALTCAAIGIAITVPVGAAFACLALGVAARVGFDSLMEETKQAPVEAQEEATAETAAQ